MQLHVAMFFAAQAAASGYALVRGGAPERAIGGLLAVAALATWALPFDYASSFRQLEWGRLAIDVALLLGLAGVALLANRYWPMWVAAIQLDTVVVHGVRAFDPRIWALVYASLLGWAAYPIIILLVVGTLRHRRREASTGPEPDWTNQHDRVATPDRG